MMDISNNTPIETVSDKALLALIGNFIKENRIQQNKTQQEVADAAGIYRTTLVQMESNGKGNMLTFVQVMRALNLLHFFKNFEITNQVSPLALAKMQLKRRQRASITGKSVNNKSKSDW